MKNTPFHDPYDIPIARPWFDGRESAAAAEVIESGMLCQGPVTAQFETAFADRIGAKHAIAVSSGSIALLVALQAMGIGPGDEVIVPDMTFISTATAVMQVGARPVFCDINLCDYNLAPHRVEQAITEKTRAIIPVHYAGQLADMNALVEIARHHDLQILEDAAEAHLSQFCGGKFAGTIGDAGIFSFTPTKLMTTGEGGMIVTDHDEMADRCRLIRNFGDRGKFQWDVLGFNYRLTDVAAAIGLCQLDKLDGIIAARRDKARRYNEALQREAAIITPHARGHEDANYQLYTIRLRLEQLNVDRDAVIAELAKRGISTRLYFPALHHQNVFAQLGPFDQARFPNAMAFEASSLSLPIFTGLTVNEQDYVIDTLTSVIASHRKS